MGEVRVTVKISALNGKQRATVMPLLVDTGATLAVVPSRVLQRIGIVPCDTTTVVLADGREVERKVGEARFEIEGHTAPALVVFGEARDEPVVGVTVLEQIRLGVDPVRGRLVPTRLLYV